MYFTVVYYILSCSFGSLGSFENKRSLYYGQGGISSVARYATFIYRLNSTVLEVFTFLFVESVHWEQ